MTRLRKSHLKSRLGCLPCKKRHIKCGEELPSCQSCIKRHVECIYGELRPSNTRLSSRASSTDHTSPACSEKDQESQLPPISSCRQNPQDEPLIEVTRLEELHLMLHYTNETYQTMSHETDINVWRTIVPEEAVRHEFLMDGLLALSSLHLAFERPELRQRYTKIAIQYQSSGLRHYTAALEHITVDNSHALFAYAIIITILALAFPGVCQGPAHSSHIESIISMCELLQGVGVINQVSGPSFRSGKFKELFQPFPFEPKAPAVTSDVASALVRLRERAASVAKYVEPDRHQVYLSGIESLELVFGQSTVSKYLGSIMGWPTMISEQLLGFFRRGDPMAQLIFLHYGVLLLQLHDRWWGRNFGIRLIEDLKASLCAIDPEWASWTEWASNHLALFTRDD